MSEPQELRVPQFQVEGPSHRHLRLSNWPCFRTGAMHSDTLMFIDGLFGRCALPEQTFITLTALPPERSRYATPSRHILLAARNGLIQALECLEATNRLGWGACVA